MGKTPTRYSGEVQMKTKTYGITSIELFVSPKSTKRLTERNEIIRTQEVQNLIAPNQIVVINTAYHESSWVLRGVIRAKYGGALRIIIDNGVRIATLLIENCHLTIERNEEFVYLDGIEGIAIKNGQSAAVTIVTKP